MTIRTFVFTTSVLLTGCGGLALAQPAPRAPAPGRTVPAKAPAAEQAAPAPEARTPQAGLLRESRREGQPVNIKVEVTITDQRGGAQALKKTVTVVTGDSMSGFIRSAAYYSGIGPVPLNIDTEPVILTDGKIRMRLNLQYDLPASLESAAADAATAGRLQKTEIRENLALILESGKALIAAQSADPVGDRQVTVEVKATILR